MPRRFIRFEPPPDEEADWRRIGLGFFPAPLFLRTRRRRPASSCVECRLANCFLSPCTLPFSAPGEEEARAEELRDRGGICRLPPERAPALPRVSPSGLPFLKLQLMRHGEVFDPSTLFSLPPLFGSASMQLSTGEAWELRIRSSTISDARTLDEVFTRSSIDPVEPTESAG